MQRIGPLASLFLLTFSFLVAVSPPIALAATPTICKAATGVAAPGLLVGTAYTFNSQFTSNCSVAGYLDFMAIQFYEGNCAVTSITDTIGDTWVLADKVTSTKSYGNVEMWGTVLKAGIGAGTTFTVAASGGCTHYSADLASYIVGSGSWAAHPYEYPVTNQCTFTGNGQLCSVTDNWLSDSVLVIAMGGYDLAGATNPTAPFSSTAGPAQSGCSDASHYCKLYLGIQTEGSSGSATNSWSCNVSCSGATESVMAFTWGETEASATVIGPCTFFQLQCWWYPLLFMGLYSGFTLMVAQALKVPARGKAHLFLSAVTYGSLVAVILGMMNIVFPLIMLILNTIIALRLRG